MPNKKINELSPRTPSLTDLIIVGDPSTGYSYRATISVLTAFAGSNIQFSSLGGISLTSPANGQVLQFNGTSWVNYTPTTWNTAYDRSLVSAAVSGSTTKTLTLTKQDGSTLTATWSDLNTDAVTSVFGRTGAVVATEGDYSLDLLSDVTLSTPTTNQVLQYNGTAWVNGTISVPVTSVFGRTGNVVATEGDYTLTQLGDVTLTTPSSNQVLQYNGTAWVNATLTDNGITSLNGLTALSQTFATGTSGTDFAISSTTSTHTFNLPTASGTNRGALSSADWTTFNSKVGGSGTTNYLSKWTSSSALGNSLVFDNGTNVGIGTTSPGNKFQVVVGNVDGIRVESSNSGYIELGKTGAERWAFRNNYNSNLFELMYGAAGATPLISRLSIFDNGNVQLGSTVDQGYRLFVNGGIGASGNIVPNYLQSGQYINATTALRFFTNSTERVQITNSGRILIGTTTESTYELDVVGDIRSTLDANINGLTVGKGGGSVANNTAVGSGALASNTTGDFNVAIGTNALNLNTTTGQNVAVGRASMQSATASLSVAIGTNAMLSAGSGTLNVAVGQDALRSSSASSRTTALGSSSAYNTTGNFNTAVGNEALYSNTSGVNQVAVGMRSLYFATGGNNIGVGYYGGYDITTGTYNTIIGTGATGNGITTGSFNTIIGSQITGLSASLSNTIILADGQGNQRLYINNTGQTGIGTTSISAGYRLEVAGSTIIGRSNATAILQIRPNNGYGGWIQITEDVQGDRWSFGVANNSGTLRFGTGSVASNTARVEFFSNGNVGIGVSGTDSGYRLDVNGTARVQTSAYFATSSGAVGINTTSPNASALLDVSSTTKGILIPRLTDTQINAITTPATGLIVYSTTQTTLAFYNGTAWRKLTDTAL